MPTPIDRKSLSKDLVTCYETQHAGGAFDVKKTLGSPRSSPQTGTTIDATSMKGQDFQSPNGFAVKVPLLETQLKDAQSEGSSKELSMYIKGFSNVKYKR